MSISNLSYAPEINALLGSIASIGSMSGASLSVNAPPISDSSPSNVSSILLSTHAQSYNLSAQNYGPSDGQLTLESKNSVGNVATVLNVTPQNNSNDALLLVNCNEIVGATGKAQLALTAYPSEFVIQCQNGNSAPVDTSIAFGTGGVNSVMITDNKLYVTDGSTVGRVYDDTIYPPPSGGGSNQTLDLTGSTLSISDGNSVTLTGDNVQPRVYPIQTVSYTTGLATPFTIATSGVYLFVFTCQMTCSGGGVPAGANINFQVGPAAGGTTAMAFAPVSQANSSTQLYTQACGIGNVAAAGNYQFIGSPVNLGMGSPVYSVYNASVTLYQLI